nr:immunoglobulin light chain junction region [Macaca mulatta]
DYYCCSYRSGSTYSF